VYGLFGEPILTIDSTIIADHLNVLNITALTRNDTSKTGFHGLIGVAAPDLWLHDGQYSLWASRDSPAVDTFVMGQSTENSWYGVFVNNAAAQDWTVKNSPVDGKVHLHSVASGGAGDFVVILGAEPNNVAYYYQNIIGTETMINQQAFGWNQAGFSDFEELRKTKDKFAEGLLPLEGLFCDERCMSEFMDFTVGFEDKYGDLGNFVDELHESNFTFGLMVNGGVTRR
jgi:alpha-glucosidase (family GH31 glycosyl hydrolase)